MRSKVVVICLTVFLLISLKSTINEISEFIEVLELIEKFNKTENTFHESLATRSAMKENFVNSLEGLETMTYHLCEIWKVWKSSALGRIHGFQYGCREIDPCQIFQDVQSVQVHVEDGIIFTSINDVFGEQLNNETYKFVDSIVAMEKTEPEKIPILLQDVSVTIDASDSDFAKSVKSLTNGLIQFEVGFHSCFKSLPNNQAKDMFRSAFNGPYFVAKNLVLILSYYLSIEFYPERGNEKFIDLLMILIFQMRIKKRDWERKDESFKAKYSVCKPWIHEISERLIVDLMEEVKDNNRYLEMKTAFKPSCLIPPTDDYKTVINILNGIDERDESMSRFAELSKELLIEYSGGFQKCTTLLTDENWSELEIKRYRGMLDSPDDRQKLEELSTINDDFTGIQEMMEFEKWFHNSFILLCTESEEPDEDRIFFHSFEMIKNEYNEKINWFGFIIDLKCQVPFYILLVLLFYICPKIPFGLYVFGVTLIPNLKHLIRKYCCCKFKKVFVDIYQAKETSRKFFRKKRK